MDSNNKYNKLVHPEYNTLKKSLTLDDIHNDLKYCNICIQKKKTSEFNKVMRPNTCKECIRNKNKKHYTTHKEYHKEYYKNHYVKKNKDIKCQKQLEYYYNKKFINSLMNIDLQLFI